MIVQRLGMPAAHGSESSQISADLIGLRTCPAMQIRLPCLHELIVVEKRRGGVTATQSGDAQKHRDPAFSFVLNRIASQD